VLPLLNPRGFMTAAVLAVYSIAAASGSVLQHTPTLPPTAGGYSVPADCVLTVCFTGANVSNFNILTNQFDATGQEVTATGVFTGAFFANNSGSPGAFLGTLNATGPVAFTFFGRTSATALGTFNAQITSFDFNGMLNGHTLEFKNNPSIASTGQTSVVPSGDLFRVTSSFSVFGEFSVDGGPFQTGPGRDLDLSPVPEPGPVGLALSGLSVLLVFTLLRRRNASRARRV